MRRLLIATVAAVVLAFPAAAAQALPGQEAAQRDWTRVVSETPEGGYRMGNPDAPVRLVEYGSISCPHCADFAEAATDALEERYVRTGQVSFEYRPFLIFATDQGIFLLMGCRGPASYFSLLAELYAAQPEWRGRLMNLPDATLERMENMERSPRAGAFVRAAGLDRYFRERDMSEAQIDACLADNGAFERLNEISTRGAEEHDVLGTPTFLINGETVEVSAWDELEPRLRAAIGSPK